MNDLPYTVEKEDDIKEKGIAAKWGKLPCFAALSIRR